MAGFRPVGSFPVASVPAGTIGAYSPLHGSIVFSGVTGAAHYQIPPLKATWIGVEAMHSGSPAARLTTIAIEVLRSTASVPTRGVVSWIGVEAVHAGQPAARVTTMAVEVLRSIGNVDNPGFCSILW